MTRVPGRLPARARGRARVVTAVVVLAVAAGCSGTSSGETDRAPDGISDPRVGAVADGLCTTAAQAATDTRAARLTFFAEAHGGLHTIAERLSQADRRAAGELLRAKQSVEAALADSLEPSAELNEALAHLHTVTRSGLALLDVTVGPCPSPSEAP